MRLLQNVRALRETPGYLRDRGFLLSSTPIGITGILLNAALLGLLMALLSMPEELEYFFGKTKQLGEMLGLQLLVGVFGLVSILTPLRLTDVFLGPRLAGYFDQVVLSGITPLRFVAGRLLSQGLLLSLIFVLLVPWIVMIVVLGGTTWLQFVACLMLIWVYSFMLAAVTLLLSMYLNELLTFVVVIAGVVFMGFLGLAPIPLQPAVLTPLPAVFHSSISAILEIDGGQTRSFFSVWMSSLVCMISVTVYAIAGIWFGPLAAVHRETSTFGEVVCRGDATQKRWFRLRFHIRRCGEMAFFYMNRAPSKAPLEVLFRWGLPLVLLLVSVFVAGVLIWAHFRLLFEQLDGTPIQRDNAWATGTMLLDCLIGLQIVAGISTLTAALVFTHSRQTAGLRLPLLRRLRLSPLLLDSLCFLSVIFAVGGTCGICGTAMNDYWRELSGSPTLIPAEIPAADAGSGTESLSAIPDSYVTRYAGLYFDELLATVLVLHLMSAMTLWLCLQLAARLTWSWGFAAMLTVPGYLFIVWLIPTATAVVFDEFSLAGFQQLARQFGLVSPLTGFLIHHRELVGIYGNTNPLLPFWILHSLLCVGSLWLLRRRERWLQTYSVLGVLQAGAAETAMSEPGGPAMNSRGTESVADQRERSVAEA